MREIDKLYTEIMIFMLTTGKYATVKMTSKYFKKVHESEVDYLRAEGFIGGIPYHIDNDISEDYIILIK